MCHLAEQPRDITIEPVTCVLAESACSHPGYEYVCTDSHSKSKEDYLPVDACFLDRYFLFLSTNRLLSLYLSNPISI